MSPDKIYYNQKDNQITPNPGNKNKKKPRDITGTISRDLTLCPR